MAAFTPERRNENLRVGTIAGGLAGKGIAEKIDPTAEEAYWKENYEREPYYLKGYTYDDYRPAYRTGWEGRSRYLGKSFDEDRVEVD